MRHLTWSTCLLAILLEQVLCTRVTYNGDQVLKVNPRTSEQVHYLQELTKQWRLDLWKPDIAEEIYIGRDVHVRVQAANVPQMKEKLLQQNIPYTNYVMLLSLPPLPISMEMEACREYPSPESLQATTHFHGNGGLLVMIEDVQKLIDSQPVRGNKARAVSLDTYAYTEYHPMDEIYTWMELIKDKHSNLVTQHLLAHSYEERPIYYFKIGFPSTKTKKVIFMDCGIHAREWISPAYCQWFVKEILARQEEPLINKILKQVDLYVIPVVNVDGYIYSFTTDRLWRKNRSPHNNGTCFGVDLNRNFDSHWGTTGTSPDCESILFCGPRPASELETQGVVRLLEPMKSNTLMYLTIHSYGQYILLPYGQTYFPSVNHYEMTKAAEKAADELKKRYNTEYTVGSTAAVLYYTSGSSADWAIDLDILFSYTYELRDEGSFGFELPADQIEPTCEETWDSMVSLFGHLSEKHLGPLDDNDGVAALSSHWLHVVLSISLCIYYALIYAN